MCPFFQQRGSCRYGGRCRFLHAEPGPTREERSGGSHRTAARAGTASSAPNQTSVSSSDSRECCGICLENISASGKRFGLLNCDHVYCLGEYSFGTLRCCLFFKRCMRYLRGVSATRQRLRSPLMVILLARDIIKIARGSIVVQVRS